MRTFAPDTFEDAAAALAAPAAAGGAVQIRGASSDGDRTDVDLTL